MKRTRQPNGCLVRFKNTRHKYSQNNPLYHLTPPVIRRIQNYIQFPKYSVFHIQRPPEPPGFSWITRQKTRRLMAEQQSQQEVSMKFTKPFQIGQLQLKNRFIMAPVKSAYGNPKGEVVIVYEGAHEKEYNDDDIKQMLRECLKTEKVKAAASIIADKTGLSKTHIYDLAIKMKQE